MTPYAEMLLLCSKLAKQTWENNTLGTHLMQVGISMKNEEQKKDENNNEEEEVPAITATIEKKTEKIRKKSQECKERKPG